MSHPAKCYYLRRLEPRAPGGWEYLHPMERKFKGKEPEYVELPGTYKAATFTGLETLPWLLQGYRPQRILQSQTEGKPKE